MENIVEVKNLKKIFEVKKKKGPAKEIIAVNDITFNVEKGETVAFVGPNGAGKSTTIKILTGILYPSSGKISVCGYNPQKDRKKLAYKIGTVFGQRSQLSFHLSAKDTFELFEKVYEIEHKDFVKRLKYLTELFQTEEFIDQPVRKLSLGQRMRCEIIASLLHNPEIVFLDEPTIGLDVVAKRDLRDVLRKLNKEWNTTIFLTSHDTGDIEALCKRTIIINNGVIIYDGDTYKLKHEHITEKRLYIRFVEKGKIEEKDGLEIISEKELESNISLDTEKISIKEFLKDLINDNEIADINIEDPSLEEVISNIYKDNR